MARETQEEYAERRGNPMKAAQRAMRPPVLKRFYKHATAGETEGGFALLLDGKTAKTPAKKRLVLPTRALAEAIAAEWAAQESEIDPLRMPLTRLANLAIDRVDRGSGGDPRGDRPLRLFRSRTLSRRRAGGPGGVAGGALGSDPGMGA